MHIEGVKSRLMMWLTLALRSGPVRDSPASVIFLISHRSCLFIFVAMGKHKAGDPCPQLTEMEQSHGISILQKHTSKMKHKQRERKEGFKVLGWRECQIIQPYCYKQWLLYGIINVTPWVINCWRSVFIRLWNSVWSITWKNICLRKM